MSRARATTELGAGEPVAELLRPSLLAVLERVPLFQGLPRRHRRKIADLTELRRYQGGEVIVSQGDPGSTFDILVMGQARVTVPNGEERMLGPGDQFGELALLDGAPRAATVTAEEDVTLARVKRADFQRLLRDEPGFAAGLLAGLALVARDLLQADAQRIVDHAHLGEVDGGPPDHLPAEALGQVLRGRQALGWLRILGHVAIFQSLPQRHLRRLAGAATIQRYQDGETVVLAGSRGDCLHVILDGRARVRTPSGHRARLGPNDCFGELALIDGGRRSATVTAFGELTTARISREDFRKLLKSEPGMAAGVVDGLVRIVRDMQRGRV